MSMHIIRKARRWLALIACAFAVAACGGSDAMHDDADQAGTAGMTGTGGTADHGTGTGGAATTSGSGGHAMSAGEAGGGRDAQAAAGHGAGGASAAMHDAGTTGAMHDGGAVPGADAGSCKDDACPSTAGVTIGCKTRFMFGVNFAWLNFGADFGGGAQGAAQNQDAVRQAMQDMKESGVDVIRWWMHPSFFGGGVTFDGAGTPSALGGSELADIDAALALAAEAGVHLKLTLFSFDNFKPDSDSGHSLNAVVTDDAKRKALIDNVVRPIARAVSQHASAARMISWDVINEPEWAIRGNDGYGDQDFDPQSSLQQVDFPTMQTFVRDVVSALHDESTAPVTVGQAAIKWSHAFTEVGLDYYDMHYYGWVDQYFPLGGKSLADYGVGDLPVVVGEFPLDGWTNPNGTLTANQIVSKLFDLGYAGAKAWAYTKDGNWAGNKGDLKTFAADHACETQY